MAAGASESGRSALPVLTPQSAGGGGMTFPKTKRVSILCRDCLVVPSALRRHRQGGERTSGQRPARGCGLDLHDDSALHPGADRGGHRLCGRLRILFRPKPGQRQLRGLGSKVRNGGCCK